MTEIHPSLGGLTELSTESFSLDTIEAQADCVFSCLPHGAAAEKVGPLVDRGLKVVDFSADYRLGDLRSFEETYQVQHADPLADARIVRRRDRRCLISRQSRVLSNLGDLAAGAATETETYLAP